MESKQCPNVAMYSTEWYRHWCEMARVDWERASRDLADAQKQGLSNTEIERRRARLSLAQQEFRKWTQKLAEKEQLESPGGV